MNEEKCCGDNRTCREKQPSSYRIAVVFLLSIFFLVEQKSKSLIIGRYQEVYWE